jgi:1,4-dihydroxy-6-naphthoate synthase
LKSASIAIPGQNTTANFLMSFAYPKAQNKTEILFSEIENSVLDESVDAGVIIHENRFTYQDKGLVKIADLGEVWERETGFPIPLGGIAIKRDLSETLKQKIDALLKHSVQYAFDNPEASKDYVSCHAQEMEEEVMRAHINLYVNDYSLNLGSKGKAAIEKMYEVGKQFGIPELTHPLFV